MREKHYIAICDMCNKEEEVKDENDLPIGWFKVSIEGREKASAPLNYPVCPRPEYVLQLIHTNSIVCSRKCLKDCVKSLLER